MHPSTLRQLITITGLILTLISLILVIMFSYSKCPDINVGGYTFDCDANLNHLCLHYRAWIADSTFLGYEITVSCPWGTRTVVLSMIALIISIAFFGLMRYSYAMSLGTVLIGCVGEVLLVTSIVLMGIDIHSGTGIEFAGYKPSQIPFILTIVITAIAVVDVGFGIVRAYRMRKEEEDNPYAQPMMELLQVRNRK